jgi:hypothetical protein
MTDTKLYEIWQLLTRIEQRELRRWLAYDTVRDDVVALYDLLCGMRDNGATYNKTAAFTRLYGEAEYNDNWLRHAQSFLVKNIEDFLVHRAARSDENLRQQLLTTEYRSRNYQKGSLQTFRTWHEQLHAAPQNAETLHRLTEAEIEWQAYQMPLKVENDNLQTLLEVEDKAYAARKLRSVCTALSYQAMRKTNYDFGLLTDLLRYVEAQNWQDTTPAIGAYYNVYKMLTSDSGISFFNVLVEKLPAYKSVFLAKEYKDLYVSVVNFAIQEINRYGIAKHGETFLRQLFGLYQTGVASGYLLNQKQITVFTYKNIVAIGLRLGEYTYIRQFLDDYRTALPTADRLSYYRYNLARFYFVTKDYEQAMPLLNQISSNQHFLLLDSKLMLLKIYFELHEYDVLDAHLRTFGQFLHRKRSVLTYHQENYKNIIAFTKQLMLLENLNTSETEALRETISSTNPLTEREWLLAQVV